MRYSLLAKRVCSEHRVAMARILLAEDDTSMREYLQRALQRVGYEVEAVGCGTDRTTGRSPRGRRIIGGESGVMCTISSQIRTYGEALQRAKSLFASGKTKSFRA